MRFLKFEVTQINSKIVFESKSEKNRYLPIDHNVSVTAAKPRTIPITLQTISLLVVVRPE